MHTPASSTQQPEPIAINSAPVPASAKGRKKNSDRLTHQQADPLRSVVTIGELEQLAGLSRDGIFSESFHFWSGIDAELRGPARSADGHQVLRVGGQRLRGRIMARVQQGELCLIGGVA